MSRRTTMVLGGLAIALLAYILIFERGTLSTGELEARQGRVIQSFVRARISRIELRVGDDHVLLVRARNQSEEDLENFGVGDWLLEAPVHAPADGEAVDGLMSSLEWLDARRTLEGITAADRTRFGFDAPQATVGFTVANETHRLLVGGEDPRGEGLYVTLDEGDTAWICGRDLMEALRHDADHFRDKDLFPDLVARDARRVEITNTDTHAVLVREENAPWQLTEPTQGYARGGAVEGVLQFAIHARATRFVREEAGDDVGTPTRELRVERAPAPAGTTGEAADRSPLRLRITGACPDHEGEVVAIVGDGPVVCMLASDLEPLDVSLEELRELRLATTPDDRVDSITFARGGESFALARHESGWTIGVGDTTEPGSEDAIGELMRGLRGQEAQEFVPYTAEAAAAHGLDTPTALITIARSDDGAPELLALGRTDALGAWVRRGDEPQIARFDLAAGTLFDAHPFAFHERALVHRDPERISRLRITRGASEEVAERAEDGWRLTEPAIPVADEASVRDVTRAVGGLEATRFVAASATTAHGLDHPRYVVTAHFDAAAHDDEHEGDDEQDADHDDEATDVTIQIGAATDGGAYARLESSPLVFLVTSAFVDAIALPLASRDLIAIPTGDLSALSITSPASRVALREEGAGWVTDLGPVAIGPATAMLDRLASLRASGVEPYGTAMPAATITIEATHRSDGSVVRLEIGPAIPGETSTPYRLGRITNVPVVFHVPEDAAAAFAAYRP